MSDAKEQPPRSRSDREQRGTPESTSGVPDDELLRREIDGENAPEQSEALSRRLAGEPGLRARYDAASRAAADLGRVGMVEAPPDLVAAVMRELRRRAVRKAEGWGRVVAAAFARRPAFGYLSSLAAGVIVGALAILAAGPGPAVRRDSAAAGTMLPGARLRASQPLDRQELAAGGASVQALTRQAEGRILAEIRIEQGSDVEIAVEFDPGAYQLTAFERRAGSLDGTVLERGRLRLSTAGLGEYGVILSPAGPARPPLRVRLEAGGGLAEKDLRTTEGG